MWLILFGFGGAAFGSGGLASGSGGAASGFGGAAFGSGCAVWLCTVAVQCGCASTLSALSGLSGLSAFSALSADSALSGFGGAVVLPLALYPLPSTLYLKPRNLCLRLEPEPEFGKQRIETFRLVVAARGGRHGPYRCASDRRAFGIGRASLSGVG